MLMDAIPVEAVIATLGGAPKNFIISRSRTVFPVPEMCVDEVERTKMVQF